MRKRVTVIGAGPGGLAAAMLLASHGYEIDVYEKQPYVGGRNSAIKIDGYTFDMGPTFLSMPHIVEEMFEAAGRNAHDYLELKRLTRMYELVFHDKKVNMTDDAVEMKKEIERHFPGNGKGYERFMSDTAVKMDALTPLLQSQMDRYYHYLRPSVFRALPHLSLGKSLYDVLSTYFSAEQLKLAFTFQSKYLGMSPWECPGAFSILSYMEHAYGVYHPIGGVNQLSEAMAQVVKEYGGRIHLNNGVKKLWIEAQKVKGIVLESGEKVPADDVVINGDFAHAMTNLVDEGILKKYEKKKLENKKYSCSTFMIYLGVNKQYDLPHHTIIFADDYKKNVEEITKTLTLPEDPSIYIQNASVTDPTLAPAGKSALYILAPVPNNFSEIEWDDIKDEFKKLVLKTVKERTEFKDIEDHIEVERILSPKQWEEDIYVYKGATFNLGHQLSQMMVLRPHNRFEELEHCWLVGGGTHPGSGLPTILESARITTKAILKRDAKSFNQPIQTTTKLERVL
ncbi:phytoene desaturase family protein [Metabacillus iocasae]|uniref:Phytoene desaturase n=1 Tax=Priestia iocasae TaxID=2291674 RepID=A0ABS2QUM0_9BACI|nr:phytoene desaturase family protein [Metabacillus iocasae]MBM7702627.1 phytoene desaturase [Metabacillus iocasae]